MTLHLTKFEHTIEGQFDEEIELTFTHTEVAYQRVDMARVPVEARRALLAFINQDRSEPVHYSISGFSAETPTFFHFNQTEDLAETVTVGLRGIAPSSIRDLGFPSTQNPRFLGWMRDIEALITAVPS